MLYVKGKILKRHKNLLEMPHQSVREVNLSLLARDMRKIFTINREFCTQV